MLSATLAGWLLGGDGMSNITPDNNINRPTTLAEIAKAMGKHKRTIELQALTGGWKYTEALMRGRNKRRLYDLKDLPQEVQFAVLRKRLDDDSSLYANEQQELIKNADPIPTIYSTERQVLDNNVEVSNRLRPVARNSLRGQSSTADIPSQRSSVQRPCTQNVGDCFAEQAEKNPMDQDSGRADMVDGGWGHGDAGMVGLQPNQGCEEKPEKTRNTDFETSDTLGADSGQSNTRAALQNTDCKMVGQQPSNLLDVREPDQYSAEQRAIGRAIGIVMRWIERYPGFEKAALLDLNRNYKTGTLPSTLMDALNCCKHKASGKAKTDDVLTKSTVGKWKKRFEKKGHYMPGVRQKDMTLKPWHVDLVAMLEKNPQKKPVTWMVEQLQAKYGNEVSKDMVYRYVKDFSRGDVIKGKNSGMQLRAKQAYQPRTSAGLEPWQEMHADGWTTHFTAPHPITGEFVTYEIWDFHDVATRYVPPFGIGLTECFEVIAKGIENAIRDNGVMCHLQTDSTKIVKDNARFVGDPVTSIADKAGFTIVHPKTVGNAQANGIAENFHTWMDKEARELATYQAKNMDSLTLRRVKKVTAEMVKAANHDEMDLYEKLKAKAAKTGGGLVLDSYEALRDWLESKRCKWNNKPHRALKKIRDSVTGKLRHQTPQECLDEHKANGWEPVPMSEADLADLFLVHKPVTVRRGMVKPYGGMLFRNPELDHWEGEKVIVAYDSMDYKQVWVKDLKGRLICIAPFLEPTGYRAVTSYEAAQEKRALAAIKNREKQIEAIAARAGLVDHNVIDVAPSSTGLKRVEDSPAQAIEAKLKVVSIENPETEDEVKPKSYLELWDMLLSKDKDEEEEQPIDKDGTAEQ